MAIDPEGRITALNRKGCDILGYDHESIIGTSWFDYMPTRHRESVIASFEGLMSGEIKPVEASVRPILTASGGECIIRCTLSH